VSLGASGAVFKGCEISLEELAEHIKNIRVDGQAAKFSFIDCIVHYRGGPIPAKELLFSGSLLEFQVNSVPGPSGILALREFTANGPNAPIVLS
jgi:hypothetical protein